MKRYVQKEKPWKEKSSQGNCAAVSVCPQSLRLGNRLQIHRNALRRILRPGFLHKSLRFDSLQRSCRPGRSQTNLQIRRNAHRLMGVHQRFLRLWGRGSPYPQNHWNCRRQTRLLAGFLGRGLDLWAVWGTEEAAVSNAGGTT